MNFNEFTQCIKEAVEAKCNGCMKADIRKVLKNNSIELTGITICEEGEKASPTIYLENSYEDYMKGRTIEEIADDIMSMYDHYKGKCPVDIETFLSYDNIKDKILYKVINTARNALLLENIPHKDMFDLSVVYYCRLGELCDGNVATTIIHNEHMNMWGITEEELYIAATDNMKSLQPHIIISFRELFEELAETEMPEDGNMYLVTSKSRMYGACLAFDSEVTAELYELLGDFYIIPSSVHEAIIIPKYDNIDENYLLEMVAEVNESQVPVDEVLSDNVYLYSGINNEFYVLNNIKEEYVDTLDN